MQSNEVGTVVVRRRAHVVLALMAVAAGLLVWASGPAQFTLLCVLAAVVYGLSKWLRCRRFEPFISEPRRSALLALAACGLLIVYYSVRMWMSWAGHPAPSARFEWYVHSQLSSLVSPARMLAIYVILALPVMLIGKERLRSVGLMRRNLREAYGIGAAAVVLIALYFFLFRVHRFESLPAVGLGYLVALVNCSLVGFGEEFFERGLVQTRLCAWLGPWRGWLCASTIGALMHLPKYLFVYHKGPWAALVFCVSLLPFQLLMGFFMLRTRSLLASTMFHSFWDWFVILVRAA